MMRRCMYLLIAVGLAMVGAAWACSGCSDPATVARREIDRVMRTTQQTEATFKRATSRALLAVAAEERARLEAQGCSAAPAASQPAICAPLVTQARSAYEARKTQIVAAAGRVDAAIGALYAALLVAVDLETDVEAGVAGVDLLRGNITLLVRTLGDVLNAYRDFRAAYGGAP
jgi:hypothetical protein